MKDARTTKADDIRWEDIYDFISLCGQANDPTVLAIEALNNLEKFCPFDQALIYFFDGNGKICDQYLKDIDESWSTMYLEHYFKVDDYQYSCFADQRRKSNKVNLNPSKPALFVREWAKETSNDFVQNLIRPRGLKYTCSFPLYDLYGNYRTVVALDRVAGRNFTGDELMHLQRIIPHLNNLHKNFYYQGFRQNTIKRAVWERADLTGREIEIADLLCLGISPASISRSLHIALSTTYKHIANIYKKLQVSNRQELLVRLLRDK